MCSTGTTFTGGPNWLVKNVKNAGGACADLPQARTAQVLHCSFTDINNNGATSRWYPIQPTCWSLFSWVSLSVQLTQDLDSRSCHSNTLSRCIRKCKICINAKDPFQLSMLSVVDLIQVVPHEHSDARVFHRRSPVGSAWVKLFCNGFSYQVSIFYNANGELRHLFANRATNMSDF